MFSPLHWYNKDIELNCMYRINFVLSLSTFHLGYILVSVVKRADWTLNSSFMEESFPQYLPLWSNRVDWPYFLWWCYTKSMRGSGELVVPAKSHGMWYKNMVTPTYPVYKTKKYVAKRESFMVYHVLNASFYFYLSPIHIHVIGWLYKGAYLLINTIVSVMDICVADIICGIDGTDIVEIIIQSEYHLHRSTDVAEYLSSTYTNFDCNLTCVRHLSGHSLQWRHNGCDGVSNHHRFDF